MNTRHVLSTRQVLNTRLMVYTGEHMTGGEHKICGEHKTGGEHKIKSDSSSCKSGWNWKEEDNHEYYPGVNGLFCSLTYN